MIGSDATFRILALCCGAPGNVEVTTRLRDEIRQLSSWDDLTWSAEDHGLEPLLRAHLRAAGISPPPHAANRLEVRWIQHAHALAVRTRVLRVVARALEESAIPFLVLKGAAVARLVYADPRLRPMRDVDILVRPRDASGARSVLARCGFAENGPPLGARSHHLAGMSALVENTTITIEIHHALLRPTPFLTRLRYDDVSDRARRFEWAGTHFQTLGREDMLWHLYAHAFAVHVLCPGIRLISVADLVHATERWVDDLDWPYLRRRHGRLVRALPLLGHLTPWSPDVMARLGGNVSRIPADVRPITSSREWPAALGGDVLWPPEWWFRVRYGVQGPTGWLWNRLAGHPARLALTAIDTATIRATRAIRDHWRPGVAGPHRPSSRPAR